MKGSAWRDQEESNLKAIDRKSEFSPSAHLLRGLEVFGLILADGLREVGRGREMEFLGQSEVPESTSLPIWPRVSVSSKQRNDGLVLE